MSAYVVWIDMDLAKVFRIQLGGPSTRLIRRREIKHHTSSDPKNHKDCEKFFHEVAGALRGAEEILLVGPGLAKEHFRAHLDRHHHTDLADRVVGTETSDHLSDARILELSRAFFRKHAIYGAAAASIESVTRAGS
jgi:stalled ribosome rescue protein Dom34